MLPVPLLVALIVAFGVDPPRAGVPAREVAFRLLETCGGIAVVAILSFGLGLWAASQVSHGAHPASRVRRRHAVGVRLLTAVALVVYGWIIHSVGWSRLVKMNWGLAHLGLLHDVIVFLPFLLIQVVIWWGQFFAERALQIHAERAPSARLGRYLLLRSRQSLGLILPVVFLFVIRRDVLGRLWPAWRESALADPIEIALLGSLVLIAAPLFIRLAWPTRPLPDGKLRRRLERAAQRAGFRFTDILVWDTGNSVLNACVTGILPRFRYVLLTDALVETMTPLEVAAVFGHEIGHIAHGHLLYFGFFFAGSLGILTLMAEVVAACLGWMSAAPWLSSWASSTAIAVAEEGTVLVLLGVYFWFVFGHLSRRFERQADVYGSKVVSGAMADLPPHIPHDAGPSQEAPQGSRLPLYREGLRTFAEALSMVAHCNGMELGKRSWRHGSIASRIRFLEHLEDDPERERRFQRDVARLRMVLAIVLVLALLATALRHLAGT
jgi:STE24 endopeptidase